MAAVEQWASKDGSATEKKGLYGADPGDRRGARGEKQSGSVVDLEDPESVDKAP